MGPCDTIGDGKTVIMTDEKTVTLASLDARVREVEMLLEMTLRIISTTKPLDRVLEHFGATETQARAFFAMLDELAARAKGREQDRPTYAFFLMKFNEIFPALRGDSQLTALVLDTLRVERPAYRELHDYVTAQRWG